MKHYVDGFVLCVPKKNMKAYQKIAELAGKVWMDHGALQYVETVADDLKTMQGMLSFPKLAKPKKGETILFSWIMYRSKKHRDAVNVNVMKDSRMKTQMHKPMPFDCKRMAYAGFSSIVNK